MKISEIQHPEYVNSLENWRKWRLTYEGGDEFIRTYLKRLSRREDQIDFNERLNISYCPAFSKAALNDVKNSIFQRFIDITREGGPRSYTESVNGRLGGVDMLGNTMNSFMGCRVLPELLSMKKVGIYVDMPQLSGPTLADKGEKHPYIYLYPVEDIRCWIPDESSNPNEYSALILRDQQYVFDPSTGFPISLIYNYRYIWLHKDGYVHIQFYNSHNQKVDVYNQLNESSEIILEIKRIPFVAPELSESLLSDTANYQIALLNMASTDVNYGLRGNFPFYTEQIDIKSQSPYIQNRQPGQIIYNETFGNSQLPSTSIIPHSGQEVRVGIAQGRQYPMGLDQPDFINPSSEPMRVSMDKQKQMKEEIRQLVNLAITNLTPRQASAESKSLDNTSLESGLSYIGLELEAAERRIAEYWAAYEGNKNVATIAYPQNYSLTSESDRQAKAKSLQEMIPSVPSITYQREMTKQIATINLEGKIEINKLRQIYKEIDAAPVVVGDPNVIGNDVDRGILDRETASRARLYPSGTVERAEIEHAKRLREIMLAQSPMKNAGARGVNDLAIQQNGKDEKVLANDNTFNPSTEDQTRGPGK